MKAVCVIPGQPGFQTEINIQELCSTLGYPSFVYPYDDPVCLACDDDGIANHRPPNRTVNGQIIPGPFYVLGYTSDGELTDLSPVLMDKYLSVFSIAEAFPPGFWKITTKTEETKIGVMIIIESSWVPELSNE